MYLKNDELVVRIGPLTFTSYDNRIGNRYILDPKALIGWHDGPGVRRNSTSRLFGDGDFYENSRKTSRVITITGTAIGESYTDLHNMRDEFVSLFEEGEYDEMSVSNKSGTRYARVTRNNSISWLVQHDTFASWMVELYAPDPCIYGEEKQIDIPGLVLSGGMDYPMSYPLDFSNPVNNGAVQIVRNEGNTNAWGVFVVTGNYFGGFSITDNRGNYITYEGDVTSAAPVVIDISHGSAAQNGVDKSYNLSQRDWFPFNPNTPIEPSFIPRQIGNGWCIVLYRDTWI